MRKAALVLSAVSLALAAMLVASCAEGPGGDPVALESEVRRLAGRGTFWPGFDPVEVPMAVFDGERTFLFRHPSPPGGFEEEDGLFVFEGRHPAVVANSSTEIGAVPTATAMIGLFPEGLSLRGQAAVMIHESFHVFQAGTGRNWHANEVDLFLYPMEAPGLLALRRLETEALSRAVKAPAAGDAAGWARLALELRQERFGMMEPRFTAYERGIETGEGTAAYVQRLASGDDSMDFLDRGFAPDDIRNRAYWTGVAMALLLDRMAPGWKKGFGGDDSRHPDTDLASALEGGTDMAAKSFDAAERAGIEKKARADAASWVEQKELRKRRFLSRPGWRLVFEAREDAPLWPRGFDPLNFHRVEGGILHTRYLIAANESGDLTVMGGSALTEGIGPHPLFNGIRRITITGIEEQPRVLSDANRVLVKTPACEAEFEGTYLSRPDSTIVIITGR